MTGAVVHVQSHLLIGDGFARHVGTSVWTTEISLVPARSGQHSHAITPSGTIAPAANLAVGTGQGGCR